MTLKLKMQTPRELFLELEKEAEEQQLAEIMSKPTLSPEELWLLTEKNFILWRKKYDYPRLLASFDEKLPRFKEWREVYGISHEEIMDYTITICIAPKHKKFKNREKYIIKGSQGDLTQTFVADDDMSGSKKDGFGRPATYQLLKKFIPYSDWRKANSSYPDFSIKPTRWHSPSTDSEQVFLDTGHELLKMGGLDVPINGANVLLTDVTQPFWSTRSAWL